MDASTPTINGAEPFRLPLPTKKPGEQGIESELVISRWRKLTQLASDQLPHFSLANSADSGELELHFEVPPGRLLGDYLSKRWPPLVSAIELAIRILDSLKVMHEQGFFHGRISPELIWISDAGSPYLLEDVESRINFEGQSGVESRIRFYSPEQLNVTRVDLSPASDLYSIGELLYYLFSKQHSISSKTLNEYVLAVVSSDHRPLRSLGIRIPAALDRCIQKLLHPQSTLRYQTAQSVIDDLKLIIDSIKGKDSPVPFAPGMTDERVTLGLPAILDRTDVTRLAKQIFAEPSGSSLTSLLVTSEAGLGKSTFLKELQLEFTLSGAQIVLIPSEIGNSQQPIHFLKNVLRRIDHFAQGKPALCDQLTYELAGFEPTLSQLMPLLFGNSTEDQSQEEIGATNRFFVIAKRIFDALFNQKQPISVFVDDLHSADSLSLEIIQHVLTSCTCNSNSSALFVATTNESTDSLKIKQCFTHKVELSPLTDEQVSAIIQSITGRIPDDGLRKIVDYSRGNPFLALTAIAELYDTKKLVSQNGKWTFSPFELDYIEIGSTDPESIQRRVQSLPVASQAVLATAALFGKAFNLTDMQMLTDSTYESLADALKPAAKSYLVHIDHAAQRASFVGEEVREAFAKQIPNAQKPALHRKIALILEEGDEERHPELAVQFDLAGNRTRAFHYARLSAISAKSRYDLDTASFNFELAKKNAANDQHEELFNVLILFGETLLDASEYDAAAKELNAALDIAVAPIEKAQANSQLAELQFKKGNMGGAAELFETALSHLGLSMPKTSGSMFLGLCRVLFIQVGHTLIGRRRRRPISSKAQKLRWAVMSRMSHALWFCRGRFWTLYAHLLGLNQAEKFADTGELAKLMSDHGPAMTLVGLYARGEKYCKGALAIRKELNDPWGQGQALNYLSIVHLAACEFHKCIKSAASAVELLERTGDAWEINMSRYQLACGYLRVGQFRDAVRLAEEMYRWSCRIGDTQNSATCLDIWGRACPWRLPKTILKEQASIERSDVQSVAQLNLGRTAVAIEDGDLQLALEIIVETVNQIEKSGVDNAYTNPQFAWHATVLRKILEQFNRGQEIEFQESLKHAVKVAIKAVKKSRAFKADMPHALRELGLLQILGGNAKSGVTLLRNSIALARKYQMRMEEYESLTELKKHLTFEPQHRIFAKLIRRGLEPSEQKRLDDLVVELASELEFRSRSNAKKDNINVIDRLETLLKGGRQIVQSSEQESVYATARSVFKQLLRCQHIALMIQNEKGDWVFDRETSQTARFSESHLLGSHSQAKNAIQSGATYTGPWSAPYSMNVGSMVIGPIYARGMHVATLVGLQDESTSYFGEDEVRLTEFVASLTGAALENVEGLMHLQQLNATLEERVAERTTALEQRSQKLIESNRELQSTQEQLNLAIDEANSANEAKSRFLATMSHEIRTPLNGILGMANLAMSTALNEKQNYFVSTILKSGQALLRLLNDILDFSKIEAGKMTLEETDYSPRDIMCEVIELMSVAANKQQIRLIADFDSDLPANVMGDPARIRQIALNLVGNAVKFTESGYVAIKSGLRETAVDGAPKWYFSVVDTGIGIPKEKQNQIFESFQQADSSTTRRFGGTGLGLTITTNLVALMGGDIEVESQPDVGSEFTIALPLQSVETDHSEPLLRPMLGTKVLLQERFDAERESLEKQLTQWGADVVAAGSVELRDGSLAIGDDTFDLDLFDMVLAESNHAGDLLLNAKQKNLISIAITDSDDSNESEFDTIIRPVVPTRLLTTILAKTDDAGSARDSDLLTSNSVEAQPHTPENSTPAGVDEKQTVRILVAEDDMINQAVIKGILETKGFETKIANNGELAYQNRTESEFDLCLMDLDMPVADGIQATQMIRKFEQDNNLRPLVIVSMTAHHDEETAGRCIAAGMNEVLTKPVDPAKLFPMIARVIDESYVNRPVVKTN